MIQADKPLIRKRTRRRQCSYCGSLFSPDPRTKGRQRYCSKPKCQTLRQRKNELAWRVKNPDCFAYQREQSRLWHKAHPDYSKERRLEDPELAHNNCRKTKMRMRKVRKQKLFDKSKSILTELIDNQSDKCCLIDGSRWLAMRLTKASPLSRLWNMRDNRTRLKRASNQLPRGHMYDISGVL